MTALRARAELLRAALLSSLGLPLLACSEAPTISECSDPVADAEAFGIQRCESGMRFRPKVVSCPNRLTPLDAGTESDGPAADGLDGCSSNADCTREPYGYCGTVGNLADVCIYGCETDKDCQANQICVCGPEIGTCRDATCSSNADCEDGMLCASYIEAQGFDCNDPIRFACQTPQDECAIDADCGSKDSRNCTALSGVRLCQDVPPVSCGRPFIVNAQPRVAALTERRGWRHEAVAPALMPADVAQRTRLAEAWSQIGLMEHASIAAFARFALQLLSLGAPAELVQACTTAISDETRHAQQAFAIASAYLGKAVGPGPLSLDAALPQCSLADVVRLVLTEGCVGETIAALEVAEAHAHCSDEALRPVLDAIAKDEAEHSALAWRFVSWALQREPSLSTLVRDQVAALSRATPPVLQDDAGFDPLPYGVITASVRARVRDAAVRDVVLPCARTLLERPASRGELKPCSDVMHARGRIM